MPSPGGKGRGGLWAALVVGVVVVDAAAVGGYLVIGRGSEDGGEPHVKGPHRVPVAGSAGRAGQGGGHHWIALERDWAVPTGDPVKKTGLGKSTSVKIGTDGTRVFTIESVIPPATGTDPWPPGTLSAYDAANGKLLWKTRFQWPGDATPVAGGGVVVLTEGTGLEGSGEPRNYVALDAATGRERWRRAVRLRPPSPIDEFTFTPGVFLDGLYYYADGPRTYAIDPATGQVREQHLSKGSYVVAGPIVAGDRLVLVTHPQAGLTGRTMLDVVDKNFSLVSAYAYPDTQTAPNCAPYFAGAGLAAEGDVVASWNGGLLCAIDMRAGRLLWTRKIRDQYPAPIVSGVIPLFEENDPTDPVIGLDVRTGRQLWQNQAPRQKGLGIPRTEIGVADGTLFSLGHHVGIIDPKTGKTIFDMQPRLGTELTGGRGTYGADNFGGDARPVFAAGHIVMSRADGVWGFN